MTGHKEVGTKQNLREKWRPAGTYGMYDSTLFTASRSLLQAKDQIDKEVKGDHKDFLSNLLEELQVGMGHLIGWLY